MYSDQEQSVGAWKSMSTLHCLGTIQEKLTMNILSVELRKELTAATGWTVTLSFTLMGDETFSTKIAADWDAQPEIGELKTISRIVCHSFLSNTSPNFYFASVWDEHIQVSYIKLNQDWFCTGCWPGFPELVAPVKVQEFAVKMAL